MGIKVTGSSGPAGKLYQEFYTEGGIMQYYIFPLEYENKPYTLEIDYTYKKYKLDTNNVTANFSIYSDQNLNNKIDSVYYLIKDEKTIPLKKRDILYNELNKKYKIRYTSELGITKFKQVLSTNGVFVMTLNESKIFLEPTSKTIKNKTKIDHKLFKSIPD